MIRGKHPKKMGKRAVSKALTKNIAVIRELVQCDFRALVAQVEESPRHTADMLQMLCRFAELEMVQ